MARSLVILAAALASALAACSSHGSPGPGPATSPQASIANPTGFPLFAGARILAAKRFVQRLEGGRRTYAGREVIAASPASFAQLQAWVDALQADPPDGYARSAQDEAGAAARRARRYGVDFALFTHSVGGTAHGVAVVVMNPAVAQVKLAPIRSAIGTFERLPAGMRASIDARVEASTGFSLTAVLQPQNPIGASLSALDTLASTNQRGIVIVDAARE